MTTAIDIIADYLATEGDRPPMPSYEAAERLLTALTSAGFEVIAPRAQPDRDLLRVIVDAADWKVDYETIEVSPIDHAVFETAIGGWECPCCRPDVGWLDHARLERRDGGQPFFWTDCGHCGAMALFDLEGNDYDEPVDGPISL